MLSGSVLDERLVFETEEPPLAGFRRRDDRVVLLAGVLAGMTVWRRIAAERRAAALARAQMYPRRTELDALFAFLGARRLERADSRDVSAHRGHVASLYCA